MKSEKYRYHSQIWACLCHYGCKSTQFFRIDDKKARLFVFISEKRSIFAEILMVKLKFKDYEDTNRVIVHVDVVDCAGAV